MFCLKLEGRSRVTIFVLTCKKEFSDDSIDMDSLIDPSALVLSKILQKNKINFCIQQKATFLKPYIIATWCRRPLLFQSMNVVRSKTSQSLECVRFKPSGLHG